MEWIIIIFAILLFSAANPELSMEGSRQRSVNSTMQEQHQQRVVTVRMKNPRSQKRSNCPHVFSGESLPVLQEQLRKQGTELS